MAIDLQVEGLTKSFGALTLFENISFSIEERQRIGLIARNGKGKSTLLKIVAGGENYDSGSIVFRKDVKVGYLEQEPLFAPGTKV
ncbi:MAG: ABC-F family ATP-binding cassette domain-containing protein, partial [Bacteroidaceae bacterium]|nr:ABC-F family ATP-binding cassette domain-containing protein [Bacteroidaceae bacterium]